MTVLVLHVKVGHMAIIVVNMVKDGMIMYKDVLIYQKMFIVLNGILLLVNVISVSLIQPLKLFLIITNGNTKIHLNLK